MGGVYIPNMEKPTDCEYCKMYNGEYDEESEIEFRCMIKDNQTDKCPLTDIVMCKDCNRSATDDGGNTFCMWLGALRKPTDFCSYGERREDERGNSEIRR